MLTNTVNAAPELPPVTGSEEFTVELPQANHGPVINVANFNADPAKADNTAEFKAAIAAAKEQKAAKLIVPRGTYRFTSSEWLEFKGFTDFEFDGQGATLIFWKQRNVPSCLINIMDSKRVRFHDFKIDWDWDKDPIASRVRVETVDPGKKFADFKFVDYAKFPQRNVQINLIDQMRDDGVAGMGEGSFWLAPNGEKTWLSDNVLRVSPGNFNGGKMPGELKVGQTFRMSHYYGTFTGVAMSGNEHLTLEDIDMYSCPGFAFHAYDKQQYWQMRHVNIIIPPGSQRPITVSADHVHITKAKGYFKMENCEMSFGNDDCFNVNDQSRTGLRKGDKILHITNQSGGFFVGDLIEFRKDDFSTTNVCSKIVAQRFAETPSGAVFEMEFADALPGKDGDRLILFNREQGSRNIILRNNYFHDNRAHGMRIQARDVTIENNRFANHPMGIAITTGYTLNSWCEGYGAENILLRNNTFADINESNYHAAEKTPAIYIGVFLKSDPSPEKTSFPIVSRIWFDQNRFVNSPGLVAYISSAQNVIFTNNEILNNQPSTLKIAERGGIGIEYSANVFILGNHWYLSPFIKSPVLMLNKNSVKNINCFHNDFNR